uniref:Guanylate kinase-like domain-containing protein n=1 Tax=Eptatretus burgeri TaxID=7764 RepID=A0A8C4Q8A2_EPTBU
MTAIIIKFVGKNASGKNFHKSRFLYSTNENIVNLLKKHPVIRIVSTTTRAIRPGEVKGEDYHYISVEEHMRLRNEGQIFEEVSLGTTKYSHCKSELKKLKSGGVGILETNPEGTRQIIKHLSGVKILSFGFDVDEETQRKRMKSRDAKKKKPGLWNTDTNHYLDVFRLMSTSQVTCVYVCQRSHIVRTTYSHRMRSVCHTASMS